MVAVPKATFTATTATCYFPFHSSVQFFVTFALASFSNISLVFVWVAWPPCRCCPHWSTAPLLDVTTATGEVMHNGWDGGKDGRRRQQEEERMETEGGD
ncbi:hypothetical protein Pcinc_034580 [Petrolisthes cinctipes]|uniref:Uncharacterized protein n=1 Tax=Petrolisthes cinctipes TaxID=88211 RepID=A0AAE1EPD3_PETCI|nr:hypothetical protein Pcinc_034580 [Petrolisthes cinctipes]